MFGSSVNTMSLTRAALPAVWRMYERMDRLRQSQGKVLDRLGFGPKETPSRVILRHPNYSLRAYAPADAKGPIMLLVPAPIKRGYIWDLAPGASVVQACLERGIRPYLVYWDEPQPSAGLADFGDRFVGECVEAIQRETGERQTFLAGHSLGGLLATLYSSLHPEWVSGLVLLASPLHFGLSRTEGALGPVVEAMESRGWLQEMPARMPGSVLSQTGFLASPTAFGRERWEDWLRSVRTSDTARSHMQVERWTLDELPLAGRLMEEVVQQLLHNDAFMNGKLHLNGRAAAPRQVVAPLVMVVDEGCPVVPPASMLPFYEAAGSTDKHLLWYEGDVGVGIRHLGPLIGSNAHRQLWPRILDWVRSVSRPA